MIGVAVAAVGLFVLRATWIGSDEFIVRQYSGEWRPWNRGHGFRVRVDLDRLRAHGISKEDVMDALKPSGMVGSPGRVDPPPPGVVFMTRYVTPDRYENIILKAIPEGDLVRLKDVAKIERSW
jgi:hypothetical protein